jgi:hypothetical protein
MNALYAAVVRVVAAPGEEPEQARRLLPSLREERRALRDCPAGIMLQAIIDYWEQNAPP